MEYNLEKDVELIDEIIKVLKPYNNNTNTANATGQLLQAKAQLIGLILGMEAQKKYDDMMQEQTKSPDFEMDLSNIEPGDGC